MKKYTDVRGQIVKLKVADVKNRIASAYARGSESIEYQFEFDFEREAWLKGEADDHRIREEIRLGLR